MISEKEKLQARIEYLEDELLNAKMVIHSLKHKISNLEKRNNNLRDEIDVSRGYWK